MRKLILLAVLAAVVVGSTGCVGIQSATTEQTASLGSVKYSVTVCANGSANCQPPTNTTSAYAQLNQDTSVPTQLLFAVRLPEGSPVPDLINGVWAGKGTLLSFQRWASYEAELERLAPAPPGERWSGYVSSSFAYGLAQAQAMTITFYAPLPRGADGPALESVPWRPVIGTRLVDAANGLPANRPVSCEASLTKPVYENKTAQKTSICIDGPTPDAISGHLDAPVTDFGITGTPAKVAAGSQVTMPFLAKRTGQPDFKTTFDLAFAGGPPGARVTLDRTTASLGGEAVQPVVATVDVPAGTPAGDYPVTITGTAAGKPKRTGTAVVTVVAPAAEQPPVVQTPVESPPVQQPNAADTIAPVIRAAKLSRSSFKAGAKGVALKVSLSEAASLTLKVERVVAKRRAKAAGTLRRTVRSGASSVAFGGRIGGRRLAAGAYRMRISARDAAGNASPARTLRFRIVRG